MKIIACCLALAACLTGSSSLFAQKCGTTSPANRLEMKRQMFQNREEMRDFVRDRSAVTYVPVRFFLVAKTDGTERASETTGLQALCLLNEAYLDQDIQFYLKEFKYYNNTTVHTNPGSFSGSNAIGNQMIYNPGAINIFIVKDAGGGAAAYWQGPAGPNQGADWIVASAAYTGDVNVLPHEVGHFFSLLHPFNGWDDEGWTPADGNPVGTFASDGFTLNEFVDGTNCTIAGDYLCDTPADYAYEVPDTDCSYNGDLKDPNNELISPDEQNTMNYYYNCGSYYFSDDQKEEISNSLFSSSRNYVRPNYTPNTDAVTGSPSLIFPLSGDTAHTYNHVELQWNPVPGADRYLVDLTIPATGSQRTVVTTNSLVVTNLLPNKPYFWRVLAFNEYSTCGSYSSQPLFRTGDDVFSDTTEKPGVGRWSVQPNPVRSDEPVVVHVKSAEGVEASVSLLTMTGQVVRTVTGHHFPAGISLLEMPSEDLTPGMYLVALNSKSGVETKRVAVVK